MQVGVTGFCQGGALACLAAEHAPVSCAVPFYGYPKSHPSKVSWSLLLQPPLTCNLPKNKYQPLKVAIITPLTLGVPMTRKLHHIRSGHRSAEMVPM